MIHHAIYKGGDFMLFKTQYDAEKFVKRRISEKILDRYKKEKYLVIKDDLTNLVTEYALDDIDILFICNHFSISFSDLANLIEDTIYNLNDWKYSIHAYGFTFITSSKNLFLANVKRFLKSLGIKTHCGELELYGNHDK